MPPEFLDLPHELLSLVAEHLYDPHRLSDLKNLRLVSTECREIGIEHLFSHKRLHVRESDAASDIDAKFPAADIRIACRTLQLEYNGTAAEPCLERLALIQAALPGVTRLKIFVAGDIHLDVTVRMLLHPFIFGNKQRGLDFWTSPRLLTPNKVTQPTLRSGDTWAFTPFSCLTYLRLGGLASQAFFRLILAERSQSPLFPVLTSFSLNDDEEVQNEHVDRFLAAAATITRLSVIGCPSLFLAPLLTSIEKHLGHTLRSLRILHYDMLGVDTPAQGYSFHSLEHLSIEDGDESLDIDEAEQVEAVNSITAKLLPAVSAPALSRFNASYRLGEGSDDADRMLRRHLSSSKRFPALRDIYSYCDDDDIEEDRRAAWRAMEAISLYTLNFSCVASDMEGLFGAGALPGIL